MQLYRYEMHTHTNACSRCSRATAEEIIDAAQRKGYSGVVFTNHFYHGNTAVDRGLPWTEFVEAYAADYRRAKAYAAARNMDVLFGVEDNLLEAVRECLIYGLEPEVFAGESGYPHMELPQRAAFVRAHGGLIACAHPFRYCGDIPGPDDDPDPQWFDAIEVYNRGDTPEKNERAAAFAKAHRLPGISGGDVHHPDSIGVAGAAFFERISDNRALADALKNGRYRLIVGDTLRDPLEE